MGECVQHATPPSCHKYGCAPCFCFLVSSCVSHSHATRLSTVEDILAHPYEVKSDSFYFAGDTLIMHNKAEYRYFDPDAPAAKEPAMASSSKGGTSTGASGAGGGAGAAGSGSSGSSVAQAPAAKDTDDDGKEADVGVAAAKPDDGGDDDADDGKGSPKK